MSAKIIKLEKLGTSNLVIVFVAMLTIAADLRKVFKNFTTAKLLQFAIGLVQYAAIIPLAKQALVEFKSLTPAKANEVEAQVKQQFDIEDDSFEQALEEAIELVVDTYEWVQQGADIGKKYMAYYHKYIKPDAGSISPEERLKEKLVA
ncbi:MAG: hypothetical protein MI974_31890 [Chitinophagales bacterium]|nr:hypothetical protein [Chitinophagales bacterium]